MSKTLIVILDAIETITKTAEVVVRVPDGISTQEIEDLILTLDPANRLSLDWRLNSRDAEVHAAKVTSEIVESGKPDIVIKRLGERFEVRVEG